MLPMYMSACVCIAILSLELILHMNERDFFLIIIEEGREKEDS